MSETPRCSRCGHTSSYHGETFCTHDSGRRCDCQGWTAPVTDAGLDANCGLPGCGLPFHHHVRPLAAAPVTDAVLREALLRIFDLAENRPDIRTVVTAALSRQAEKETA